MGEQCIFLIDYSYIDRLGKVVILSFTRVSCTGLIINVYFGSTKILFGISDKNVLYGSLKLVFWQNADSAEVLN